MEYFLEHCANGYFTYLNGSIWLMLFIGGFLGSLSHCSTMCSPFILMQINADGIGKYSLKKLTESLLIFYHLGRITSYILLAVIAQNITINFMSFDRYNYIGGILLLIIGMLFMFSSLLNMGKMLDNNKFILLWGRLLSFLVNPISRSNDAVSKYLLGFILGFLPCGLVWGAIIVTATLGTLENTILGMIFFALGTIPVLISIAFFGKNIINRQKYDFAIIMSWFRFISALELFIVAYYKITT